MNLPDAIKHIETALQDVGTALTDVNSAAAAITDDPKLAQAIADLYKADNALKAAWGEVVKVLHGSPYL